ncbi:hypothetical protein Tco_0321545 [Tanacetum coccineum]
MEHTESVYLRNEEDKRRGVDYVMSKILRFYKECLELGPEYVTRMDDEGEVTYRRVTSNRKAHLLEDKQIPSVEDHFSQLCPLGLNKVHWFSFDNRRAPSPICIDDNRSCMKGWKSGFFFIDRRAIPHYMSWRHPNLGITDPKPLTSSNSQEDVWRLSAFIVKLRDMPEGVLVLFCLIMGIHDFLWFLEWTRSECWPRPNIPRSEGPLLLEVLPEPLCLMTTRVGGGSAPSVAEGPSNRDSQGKAVIDDVVDTPTRSAGHSQAFTGPTPVSRDPTDDAIDRDFFLFALGPYYATYLEDGVVADSYEDPNVCKTIIDQFPTPKEMVRIESLTDEHLIRKMSVLYCLMMSHGGELLARYKRVVEISLGARRSDTQKGDQIAVTKAYLDDIYALIVGYKHSLAEKDAEILYSRAQGRLVKATPLVATTDYSFLKKIFDHAAHPLSVVLNLEPKNLARSEVVPALKTTRVSPSLTRESTVTLDSSSCEFPSNGVPSSIVAIVEQLSLNQNEEWVHAMVDTSDIKMMDGAAGRPTKVIMQGLVIPPSDIVVALSAQKKKWGSPFPKMFWGGARGIPENITCCSELGGTSTVDVWLSI